MRVIKTALLTVIAVVALGFIVDTFASYKACARCGGSLYLSRRVDVESPHKYHAMHYYCRSCRGFTQEVFTDGVLTSHNP